MNELLNLKQKLDSRAYGNSVVFVAIITPSATMFKVFEFEYYQEARGKFYLHSEDNEEISINLERVTVIENANRYTFISEDMEVIIELY